MCKNPLFAVQQIPYEMAYDGEYIIDPCTRVDKRLKFLHCDRARFDLLKSENSAPGLKYLEVPCGQCIECRLRKSRDWAARIMCEVSLVPNNVFLTLTYSDEFLPHGRGALPSLDFSHLQTFMKDLRRYCEYHYGHTGIRYYGAGEYGDRSARPHFHLCLFNLPNELMNEMVYFSKSFNGDLYYTNPIFSQIWSKGHCIAGDLTFQSAAYVARYVVKKMTGESASVYDTLGIEPERALMSRRPGIGREFYERNKYSIYKNDEFFLPVVGRLKPSAYFDKLYSFEDPVFMEVLKGDRSLSAERAKQYKLSQTDLDYASFLKSEEICLKERIKRLVRPLE